MIEDQEAEKKRAAEEEERKKLEAEEEAKMVPVEDEELKNDIENYEKAKQEALEAQVTLHKSLADQLGSLWQNIEDSYLGSTTRAFTNIKDQRNFIVVRFAEL
mmetsp:Transcript_30270/g.27563  ORF Transcript_30270/g.27563 Transcript_30270/m.27563 type:complete len:103 (+) Transcript_30270:528-836(+)